LLELDELVVVTWTYDPTPCHRFYELLAQAFALEKPEASFPTVKPDTISYFLPR
jgi:hypothetical protein